MVTQVRLPNGEVRSINRRGGLTGTGLRRVSVLVNDSKTGRRVRVSGYVSTRDKKKIRTFIVDKGGVNARVVAA